MSTLSTQIQTVRKLKPFLEALDVLMNMAVILDGAEKRVASLEVAEQRAKQGVDAARADADSARAFATEHVANAKAVAAAILDKASAVLEEAKDEAETLILDASSKATAQLADAEKMVARREAEVIEIDNALIARRNELASIETRLQNAKAAARKALEG